MIWFPCDLASVNGFIPLVSVSVMYVPEERLSRRVTIRIETKKGEEEALVVRRPSSLSATLTSYKACESGGGGQSRDGVAKSASCPELSSRLLRAGDSQSGERERRERDIINKGQKQFSNEHTCMREAAD